MRILAWWEALRAPNRAAPRPEQSFETVYSFWIGPSMPGFHHMCLRSWLAAGHRAVMYAYEPVANLPEGCETRDARDVIAYDDLIAAAPSLETANRRATQADIFRLAMLSKGIGPWCDPDYLMLRPLPAARDILIGSEQNGHLCNAVLWAPADFEMMERIVGSFRTCSLAPWSIVATYTRKMASALRGRAMRHVDFPMHQWGRTAIDFFIRKHGLRAQVQPYEAFYWPVIYDDVMYRADTAFDHIIDNPKVHGLHFFYKKAERFESADPGSFIDWAKRRFGVSYP